MQPPEFSNAVDKRPRRADDRRMEDRLSVLEQHVSTMTVDLAIVRSNYTTKHDVADLRAETFAEFGKVHAEIATLRAETTAEFGKVRMEMNTLFWRLVTWMTSAMALLTGAVYFIARHVP